MNFLLVINAAFISLLPQMFHGLAQGLRSRGARAQVVFVHISEHAPGAGASRGELATLFGADPDDPDWHAIKASDWPSFLWQAYRRDPSLVLLDCNAVADYPLARRMSFVTDAIYSQYDNLSRNLRQGQAFTLVDRNDCGLVQRLGLERDFAFVPHGGPAALSRTPLAERAIEIFMPVNLKFTHDRSAYLAAYAEADRGIASLALEMAEDGRTVAAATCEACSALGIEVDAPRLAHLCRIVATWLEQDARRRLIAGVNRKIHIAGSIDPDFFEHSPDNVVAMGLRSGSQIGALMRESRCVINCVRVFEGGSHERLWYALANGAICLTDPSSFVMSDFVHGEDLWYIPSRPSQLEAILSAALDDLGSSQAMVAKAQEIYARRHSWEERAQRLIDFARVLGWDDDNCGGEGIGRAER